VEGEIQAFEYLYKKGTFTRPSGHVPTVAERIKEAQARGVLKK
jgi:hypothetical protein